MQSERGISAVSSQSAPWSVAGEFHPPAVNDNSGVLESSSPRVLEFLSPLILEFSPRPKGPVGSQERATRPAIDVTVVGPQDTFGSTSSCRSPPT